VIIRRIVSEAVERRATFRDVLTVPEFRAIWLAQAQSLVGDQLARVALSVLVFDRTGSPALTALVYALTFVPAILGGILLSGMADRLPRRDLMVGCDLVRAVLVGAMALPVVPLPVVCCLLVLAVLAGQPFLAAEAALLPDILSGERYVVGSGLRMFTSQTAQLAGFAGGGLAVALVGARGGLAIDAGTFVVSAVLIRLLVHHRGAPATRVTSGRRRSTLGDAGAAVRFIWADRRLRTLAAIGWLASFHVVPEALAAPYAAALGGGAREVGLLMAAPPAGTAIGVLLILRLRAETRVRLLGPLAFLSAVPMVLCGLQPGLAASLALWVLLGVLAAYQVQAAASFVGLLPDERRGRVLGLVSSGMVAGQGLGIIGFGVIGQHVSAASAIAIAGLIAAGLGLALAIASHRTRFTPNPPAGADEVGGDRHSLPPVSTA
jgi:MFS family permease